KSTSTACAITPNGPAFRISSARLAAASKAFDGTQPVLRQSPPILCRSTSTTGTPKAAAAAATDKPPEPPPITQMSGLSVSAMPLMLLPAIITQISHRRARARAQSFHHYRHQGEQAERDQRADQLRRQHVLGVEDHMTIDPAGGEAIAIRGLL